MNRESYLENAVELLRSYFKSNDFEIPEKLYVSSGFPSTGALSSRKRLGECWHATASSEGINHIYISPLIDDTEEVLGILVHELLHACLPEGTGHKKPFKQGCEKLGLEGPAKSTKVGTKLQVFLNLQEFGEFPCKKITPKEVKKKAGSRMLKLTCRGNAEHEEDYIIRTTIKNIKLGIPTCFCKNDFEITLEDAAKILNKLEIKDGE